MNPASYQGYDIAETARLTGKWLGATAQAMWGNPAFGITSHPLPSTLAAWGQVMERSLDRMVVKPDWGIDAVVRNGQDYLVNPITVREAPFARLVRFDVSDDSKRKLPKILLIAPMSGHYATLLRNTVSSLLPDADVYVTEWINARDIPVSAGSFDVEDFTKQLIDYFRFLGPDLHVMAICQPAPLALAATAWLAEHEAKAQPKSLTLVGGPVDPGANHTQVTDFGNRVTMKQLETSFVQSVGTKYKGVGRRVYPGALQLSAFMTMNWERHAKSFVEQIFRVAQGIGSDLDRHNVFYDEYLAVMDMPAEFYLSTVKRIFKDREIALNEFSLDGEPVDLHKITSVPVKIIEGGRDDISAPGQCAAALSLLEGLPQELKAHYLEPDAGHYGIFSGRAWHKNIRPLFLDFVKKHAA